MIGVWDLNLLTVAPILGGSQAGQADVVSGCQKANVSYFTKCIKILGANVQRANGLLHTYIIHGSEAGQVAEEIAHCIAAFST